ncbi:Aste57867_15685 [Aphanomyces stellatus]|uniref:Aste57867_15685 protein n=1 Tax=Aphanomyces stellatus TaxID=120398 RepID=A0A485L515_9STRA|nr:hypothetical protein As57867_015629 [Aphanomyces stellatus]VFT92478.1 Aste57867_15685 [Aphanomyces stellatus]
MGGRRSFGGMMDPRARLDLHFALLHLDPMFPFFLVSLALPAAAAAEWHMTRVRSFQARVQADMPMWDARHSAYVSSFGGSDFDAHYAAGLDTVNLASVEGVLKYVQSEGINRLALSTPCERKNKMQYIVFYAVEIVQPNASLALFGADPNGVPEYCPFVAMDGGACTTVDGTALPDDCTRLFGSPTLPAIGPCVGAGLRTTDPRAPYPNTIWFSYPNSCVEAPWGAKSAACRASFPGGLCPVGSKPDGVNCTFSYAVLGFLDLDDLVGITSLVDSRSHRPYASYADFCRDASGLYRGIEFQAPVDGSTNNQAVVSLPFWRLPFDATANMNRTTTMIDLFNAKAAASRTMKPLPPLATIQNPPCYANTQLCLTAPHGCKRELYAQVCRVCAVAGDAGCVMAPPHMTLPALARATLAPTQQPLSSSPLAIAPMAGNKHDGHVGHDDDIVASPSSSCGTQRRVTALVLVLCLWQTGVV